MGDYKGFEAEITWNIPQLWCWQSANIDDYDCNPTTHLRIYAGISCYREIYLCHIYFVGTKESTQVKTICGRTYHILNNAVNSSRNRVSASYDIYESSTCPTYIEHVKHNVKG